MLGCLPYRLRAGIKEKKSLKRFLEENVTDGNKLELLKWQDRADGWTDLHLSTVENNGEAIADILHLVPNRELWRYLKDLTRLKNTAVQIAARWNFTDILKLIFAKVSRSSDCTNCIVDLLLHQNSEGKNTLLCAADYKNFETVQLLIITAENATTDKLLLYKMLSVCDKNGRSSLHICHSSLHAQRF